MTTTKKSSGILTGVLVSVAGSIISVLVTMQLKKMLADKGVADRKGELKDALKNAGLSAADLKSATASWIADKASAAADKANSTAASAADKVADVAQTVKEKANG